MKKLMIPLALILFYSCEKKDPGPTTKNPTNHMEATVTLSSGSTVTINESGQNVTLGIDVIGNYYGNVINDQKQKVFMSQFVDYSGGYYPYYDPGNQLYYHNDSIPGDTIIYSIINGSHREGNFHFTCVKNSLPIDTVVINGSFKGEFERIY